MTRKLKPAEQLAADVRDKTLDDIVTNASDWDLAVVKQATIALGRNLVTFSANDFRDVLPEQGRGYIGAACRALAQHKLFIPTGEFVPSTLDGTNGHRIAVYRLNLVLLAAPAEERAA